MATDDEDDLSKPINPKIESSEESSLENSSEESSHQKLPISPPKNVSARKPLSLSPLPLDTTPPPVKSQPQVLRKAKEEADKASEDQSFSTEESDFDMFNPPKKINSKNVKNFQNFYQLLWYYYYYDKEKYKVLWKEYEKRFSSRILQKVGMDPGEIQSMFDGTGHKPTLKASGKSTQSPSVAFS